MNALDTMRMIGVQHFNSLDHFKQRAILMEVDKRARDRGYESEKRLRATRLKLWEEWVGEISKNKFPQG